MKISKSRRKSYVLISVLVIMTVMLVITYYLADALFSEVSIARNQKGATIAFNLAEAGISDAIWKIQNDDATKNTFLHTTNGQTIIPSKTLSTGGSYSVIIQNTDMAAATITATGLYNMGLKQAQRQTTINVIQATSPPPYTLDGSLMVGGPNPGDITITNATISYDSGYDPSSIIGGGNISVTNATINTSNDILANNGMSFKNTTTNATGDILANQLITQQNSNLNYGGILQSNYSNPAFMLPAVDVTSDCSVNVNSYKCLAQGQNQYYVGSKSYVDQSNITLNGIIYYTGAVSFTNVSNLTINGILISEGSISFSNVSNLNINHTSGPSGLITLQNFNTTNFSGKIDGLVYVGVNSSVSVNTVLTINGAILAHQFSATNANIKLNFKKDWVNEVLSQTGGGTSPVIQFEHWEEEY